MAHYNHICEACGKTEVLTSEEGFQAGWDYPPRMGVFGIVSPRTCGDCTIDKTLWWKITQANGEHVDLTPQDKETLARIQGEPESILAKEG